MGAGIGQASQGQAPPEHGDGLSDHKTLNRIDRVLPYTAPRMHASQTDGQRMKEALPDPMDRFHQSPPTQRINPIFIDVCLFACLLWLFPHWLNCSIEIQTYLSRLAFDLCVCPPPPPQVTPPFLFPFFLPQIHADRRLAHPTLSLRCPARSVVTEADDVVCDVLI